MNCANGGGQENGMTAAKGNSSRVGFNVNFSLNDENNMRSILTADGNRFGKPIPIGNKFIAGNKRFMRIVSQRQLCLRSDFTLIPRQSADSFFNMKFPRFAGFVEPVPVVKTERVV